MDEQKWGDYAQQSGGRLFTWVDQDTDSLLKQEYSKGVCLAMAHDFVTAFQLGQPGPFNFCNDIKNTSLTEPGTNRIPRKYLDIQAAHAAMLKQFDDNLEILEMELDMGVKDKPTVEKEMAQLKSDRIKQRYGPGMESFEEFVQEKEVAAAIFKRMKANVSKNGPSYFLVEMSHATRKGGHAIAFGFRADLSTALFPAIYEYFDANLGYFLFRSEEGFFTFFGDVLTRLYLSKYYSKFKMASFTAKKGKR
jgi:hypothetical protein